MSQENPLFRKVALERLSTPEQLDQLMEVTSPRSWLALIGFGLIIVGVLVWSVIGSVPEKVNGQGVFLTTGGLAKVTAATGGQLIGFVLKQGDQVRKGDVLARVAQPELAVELAQAQAEYDRLKRDYDAQSGEGLGEDVRLKLLANQRQREATLQSTRNLREYITQLEGKIRTQEELLAQGLITPQTMLNTRRELTDAQEKIRQNDIALISNAAEAVELRKNPVDSLKTLGDQLAAADDRLRAVQAKLELADRIESPYSGRVIELLASESERVTAGNPLCTLELTDTALQRLEAVLFVPAADALRIKPGMVAMLAPDNARKEEFGMMLARVTSVAGYPASEQSINRYLNNEALVKTLAGAEASVEIRAELIPDPGTASGFAWSSSAGYPEPPRSGTLCQTEVVVSEKRPIELAVPALTALFESIR